MTFCDSRVQVDPLHPQILHLPSSLFLSNASQIKEPLGGAIYTEIKGIRRVTYDFDLAAHSVKHGTCRPVHYMVVYDSPEMPQEKLAQFTYEQCFNYYNWPNWPDAVKLPGMLQCANKLANLVGEYI